MLASQFNARTEAEGWWLFSCKQDSETNKFIQILDKHFRELPLKARGCTYATHPFTGDRSWLKRVWNCINACQMPTILFESCFISNDRDCQWLKNGGYKDVAQKICDGVREYLQSSLETTLYKAVVNAPDFLNVRSGSGTNYPVVGQLNNGTSLEIVEEDPAGWVRISSPIKGWAAKRYTQRLGA
ncbi:MAG: SH3 domain-containing protein [Microcoleus sp. SM1_3_4]|nr:SH3 domain-containing protein [Microcoleus sp. SM1_3_4]